MDRDFLTELMTYQNLSFWRDHMKMCPKQGWVSKDWEECTICKQCIGSVK